MLNILYLVHRLPYPPNKGDKVRSFNILKYISSRHNVYLGTFIDDPDDEKYIPFVKDFCKELYFERINKKYSKARSLLGLLKGNALTLNYYNSFDFHAWVKSTVVHNKIDVVVIFSSVMAQFVGENLYPRMLVDFVDVDSKKWDEYADKNNFPLSWLYKRESKYLLNYERYLALQARHSFFVTEKEKLLFSSFVPESDSRTSALNNGVDSDFFSPNPAFPFPFDTSTKDSRAIVFTGAMDYWPNIDAVIWFVENVFSILIDRYPNIRFYIVGRGPSQAVLNLKSRSIFVTGTVDDVRPYLQHATVVVAPLRIARGIQNKILEAMSMAKPVVASIECVKAIDSIDGVEILSAEIALDFIKKIDFLLNNKKEAELVGLAARANVLEKYSWDSHLRGLDKYFESDIVDGNL
ncbi:MAG: TIGR03087 family PEP-CTERM/XrtA system glycosyltransferase [Rhodoferax sp.]|uniref:TIGR03087 family PEP-CTERM/XrtA system glycosyltransferase n=1 Tax=Rhodoferax sp. TaxID=50421 RepID=UPI0032663B4A